MNTILFELDLYIGEKALESCIHLNRTRGEK